MVGGVVDEVFTAEDWFSRRGWEAFGFQRRVWRAYGEGKSGLIHAPTGYGKTWAAYLGALAETQGEKGCSILWITPLRALAADTLRALREASAGMGLAVEARTGDSSAAVKKKLRAALPHTLVTTPESLSLMLTHADTRERLGGLRCVIVDEWHELLGTKRGVQTELCLARLRCWVPGLRVWGLSATLGNLTEARRALLGDAFEGSEEIAAEEKKEVRVETVIPEEMEKFPWAGHLGLRLAGEVVKAIEGAGTTLMFTNTRAQTEIWFQELLEWRPEWKAYVAMHHGSLDAEERRVAEEGLRDGSLRCVVATSSLDLGVDFSPVDQIIQVGSPKGVARLMQRAGRSGHRPGVASRILCVPPHAFELVEFAAARDAMDAGRVESRIACMNTAELARRQFREVARVAGLIPQEPPGKRVRGQRDLMVSSALLYEVLDRYDPGNLLLEQARREILERQLEMSRLRETLDVLAARPLVMVETERLTPMAFPLWADRITALMPGGDAADRLARMLEELQNAAR